MVDDLEGAEGIGCRMPSITPVDPSIWGRLKALFEQRAHVSPSRLADRDNPFTNTATVLTRGRGFSKTAVAFDLKATTSYIPDKTWRAHLQGRFDQAARRMS